VSNTIKDIMCNLERAEKRLEELKCDAIFSIEHNEFDVANLKLNQAESLIRYIKRISTWYVCEPIPISEDIFEEEPQ
jgi:hypothetical protein